MSRFMLQYRRELASGNQDEIFNIDMDIYFSNKKISYIFSDVPRHLLTFSITALQNYLSPVALDNFCHFDISPNSVSTCIQPSSLGRLCVGFSLFLLLSVCFVSIKKIKDLYLLIYLMIPALPTVHKSSFGKLYTAFFWPSYQQYVRWAKIQTSPLSSS